MATSLYIVRHAETAGNEEGRMQGRIDCDLSQKGYAQLEFLAERCRALAFDRVYTSPLLRARKTAETANRHHNAPLIIEPALIEISFGIWEGHTWKEMGEQAPDVMHAWKMEPHRFHCENGEAMTDVFDRMRRALRRIADENPGGSAVVVTHGCAVRNYLCFARGLPPCRMREVPIVKNTSISLVEYNENGVHIVFENDIAHLPEQ